jgi:hypothetical protein
MKRTLFVILFLFVTMILFISCREKNPGNDYYWGHGFGMGYGSGCFETANGLSEYLGLTKDQETKIEAVDLKYRQLYFENRGNFDKVDSLRKSHRMKSWAYSMKNRRKNTKNSTQPTGVDGDPIINAVSWATIMGTVTEWVSVQAATPRENT